MRKIDVRQLVRQQEKKKLEATGKRTRAPVSRLLRFAAELVGIASVLPPGETHKSAVPCRRRPRRRPCPGRLQITRLEPDDEVGWECPACADRGSIVGWHGSRWDREPALRSGQVVSLLQVRARRGHPGQHSGPIKAYALAVELIGGPVELDELVKRKVRIGGDRTLHEMHQLIQRAFDRDEDEPYEFMFGAPYEIDSQRFAGGLITSIEGDDEEIWETKLLTIDEIGLKEGQVFGYLFDFGEEWVHRISVSQVSEEPAYTVHPRVVERVGDSPPQYPDLDELWDDDQLWSDLDGDLPLTGVYGPYNAAQAPVPESWLALEELERLLLIIESHAQAEEAEPSEQASLLIHAVVHFIAETALAEGGQRAVTLWAGLAEQPDRHLRIHTLGETLLAEYLGQRRPDKTAQS